ncbi:uroporphyrinogen-III C-methyltransferase [Marinomonas epiphytica]
MTEKNEPNNELKQAETTPMDNTPPSFAQLDNNQPEQEHSSRQTKHTVSFVALGTSIAALLASGWIYYQSSQASHDLEIAQLKTHYSTVSRTLEALKTPNQQLQTVQQNLAKQQQYFQQQNKDFAEQSETQQQQISQLQAKVNRLTNTTKEDWKLAEAEYLVRLASQRLLLESDSQGSEALLSNADDILKSLEDPIVFDARKAIAADIQALKAIDHFDLEGQYLKLDALYHAINTLPQREPSKAWQATQTNDSESDTTPNDNTFNSTLNELWQSLKSLVVINYQSKPIEALLPPAQYQQLITGLQLQIDVAQVSMVKGENDIYQNALERVAKAVTEHFDTNSNSVTSFLATLTELQQLNPSPELPSPRNSLIEMMQLANAWKDRSSQNTEEEQEKTQEAATIDNTTATEAEAEAEITGSDLLEEQTEDKLPTNTLKQEAQPDNTAKTGAQA